jgi:hypothetical protein
MPHDEFVDEDPLGLVGMVMPGEEGQLEAMAECFVEEYARMGWNESRIMTLFSQPLFMATHRVYRLKGESYARELIHKVCARYQPLLQPQNAECQPQNTECLRDTQCLTEIAPNCDLEDDIENYLTEADHARSL